MISSYVILGLAGLLLLGMILGGTNKIPKINTRGIDLPTINREVGMVFVSALLAIILTHVFIYLWYEDLFKSWWNSKAFWFALVSIVCAALVRIFVIKNNPWYYIMLVVLPTAAIYKQYGAVNDKQGDDSGENAVQKIVTPDTTKRTFDTYLITTFSSNENMKLEMPPNTEVLQERSEGFKQITRTDTAGLKTNEIISGDRLNAPSGRAKFTIKKGGPVTLKVWRD